MALLPKLIFPFLEVGDIPRSVVAAERIGQGGVERVGGVAAENGSPVILMGLPWWPLLPCRGVLKVPTAGSQ